MMNSQNISIGIDLGTANSKIAVNINGKIEIIKKPGGVEYTPSVFGFDKFGNKVVGQKAYDHLYKLNEKDDSENFKAEVKRIMGTAETVPFPRAKTRMTPEEISAEILKSLKEDLLRKYPDFDTTSVVITVPAALSVLQSEATKRAGNLAGFKHVVLLQEPIAAAVSYGFMNAKSENWLIYDFGGGTFDLALVSCKEGVLSVLGHGGEGFLGGKDIDWEIVKKGIVPKILEKYKFNEFNRSNQKYKYIFAKLKYFAESAKMELSQYEKTTLEIEDIGKDEDGKEVHLVIPFSREEFNRIIEPMVSKTVELARNTIKDAELKESSVKRIVLVGGTTIIPYIKEKLEKEFDIKVDSSVDPLTVVANGACIFAMGQKVPEQFLCYDDKKIKQGSHKINLNYTSLTADTEESITGSIQGLEDGEYYIKIQSDSGTFTGPKTQLKKGKFYYTVKVQKNRQNLYWIYIFDDKSSPVKIIPDSFTITHGLSISGAPIPRSIKVVVEEQGRNTCEPIFNKEEVLPLSRTLDIYKTSRKLKKGEENPLYIKIVEGESENPNNNDELCELAIPGKLIPNDLPAGSRVDLTVKINESRELTVIAYIPLYDISVDARHTWVAKKIETDNMSTELMAQRKRAESVFEYCSDEERRKITDSMQSVSEGIASSHADEDEKRKADKQLKNLKEYLSDLEAEKKMPQLVKAYNARVTDLEKIIDTYADPNQKEDDKKQLDSIKTEGEKAIRENNKILLNGLNEQLENLRVKAIFSNPNTWIVYFRQIIAADNFINEKEAQYYINKGNMAIQAKNYEELKRCTQQLNLLRPVSQQKEVNLSGITR